MADDEDPATPPAARVPPGVVFRWAAAGTCGVLLVLLAAYGVYIVRTILVIVVLALFLSVSLDPLVRWLMRRGMPRSSAVAVVFGALVLLTAAFIWSVVPPIIDQGNRLVHDLPGYLQQLSDDSKAVREVTDRYHLTDRLTGLAEGLPGMLAGGAVGFFQQFIGTLASAGTVLVLTMYFMADMPRLRRYLIRSFPRRRRGRVGEIVDIMVDKVGGYMIGNLTISAFAGGASFLCLELLRVPFALPLAVTVAIADLIPMIGATLGATVCVLVSLLTVGLWPKSIVLVAFFILYQPVENYLLVPRIFRNTVDMPSAAVLLVALLGGSLLGLAGAVMAIPIAATIKVAMSPTIVALEADAEPDEREAEAVRAGPAG
ncbi:AI-2E family transporter [Dactylosporangium sp. CA-092794]|uniref:AI-2E family transporter n=1 Tax=Dactylosporangium sp. CA-092794 TaxID=3239929 RepID=UPI003D937C32